MNVRSVSKLSAAVMTLVILSYCGKKSHDAAAPAPAPETKTEAPAGTDSTKTTPAGTVPANTATTYLQPSCQTADEINTHVINADHKAEAFCFHKVEHPAASLKAGQAIRVLLLLKQDLDVAFLNVSKNFADAQTACASLGAGWHAPASSSTNATPQALDNSNSSEAVDEYFEGTVGIWFWSSSTVSFNPDYALGDYLGFGGAYLGKLKDGSDSVVCVRP